MSGGSGSVGARLAGAARSTTDPVGPQDHAASAGALGPSTTTITRPAIPLRTRYRSTIRLRARFCRRDAGCFFRQESTVDSSEKGRTRWMK
jgi:hypothetical protein